MLIAPYVTGEYIVRAPVIEIETWMIFMWSLTFFLCLVSLALQCKLKVLGADGFGRSDTREALRRFFEVDKEHVSRPSVSHLFFEQFPDVSTWLFSSTASTAAFSKAKWSDPEFSLKLAKVAVAALYGLAKQGKISVDVANQACLGNKVFAGVPSFNSFVSGHSFLFHLNAKPHFTGHCHRNSEQFHGSRSQKHKFIRIDTLKMLAFFGLHISCHLH